MGGEAAGDEDGRQSADFKVNMAGGHGGSSGRYDRLGDRVQLRVHARCSGKGRIYVDENTSMRQMAAPVVRRNTERTRSRIIRSLRSAS